MKKLTIDYIVNKLKATLFAQGEERIVDNVAIDSRKACADSLFFAIKGENNDGHRYLEDVKKNGCRTVVISDINRAKQISANDEMNVILVEDTTRALMNLAKEYLADWESLKRVAVTGSVGKTSTKDFLGAVFSSKYKTEKTPGNLNNEYGVPLTIFGLDEATEVAIIEMGAGSGVGISELADIVKPDVAVITNVWTSHLEVFGSRENLLKEKLGITKYFDGKEKLIVNSSCDLLKLTNLKEYISDEKQIMTVGTDAEDNYYISEISDKGIYGVSSKLDVNTEHLKKEVELNIPVIGEHNLGNAALAIAAGYELGIEIEESIKAIFNTKFTSGRLEIVKGDNIIIVNDTYNASPESMKAGLNVLKNSVAKRKVAILGDMFELGRDSDNMHKDVGIYAAELDIDVIVAIGENAEFIYKGASEVIEKSASKALKSEALYFEKKEKAVKELNNYIKRDDLILVKASRGMKLEDVITSIVELDKNNNLDN